MFICTLKIILGGLNIINCLIHQEDYNVNFHVFNPMILFVCVEVLGPSQPNGVMSSAVSLPNHTFTGQA